MKVELEGMEYETGFTEEEHERLGNVIKSIMALEAIGEDCTIGEVLQDTFDDIVKFDFQDVSKLTFEGNIVFPLNDAFDSSYGAYIVYKHNLVELFDATIFGGSVRIMKKEDETQPAVIFVNYAEEDFCYTYLF